MGWILQRKETSGATAQIRVCLFVNGKEDAALFSLNQEKVEH